MKKSVKKKWLKALESGALPDGTKTRQAYGELRTESKKGNAKFCCLGVLCEIAAQEGVIQPFEVNNDYDRHGGDLPMSVRNWAGLGESNPRVLVPAKVSESTTDMDYCLSELNDDLGMDFPTIATYIREQL